MNSTNVETTRSVPRKRGARGPALTAAVAAEIKRLASTTDLLQHQIAALLGINQGRVSEVLSGKRFASIH